MTIASNWFIWALFWAVFAKMGLAGVDSDLATLMRTVVIFGVLGAFVHATGKWSSPFELSGKTWRFLVLSGLATDASWVCYFRALKIGDASKVASVDKHSVLLVTAFACSAGIPGARRAPTGTRQGLGCGALQRLAGLRGAGPGARQARQAAYSIP